MKNIIILTSWLSLLSPTICFAQAPCVEGQTNDVLASASTWDNLRNSENSIKFKIGKLLKEGIGNSTNAKFTIASKPQKLLSDYSDKVYCEAKKQETSNTKLIFASPKLGSLDNLNSWIADFSQGKGKQGGELYEKCDKTCSPEYEYQISYNNEKGEQYEVKALVICGHARDKDDNQYKLSLQKCVD